MTYVLAVDMGASGGRHILAHLEEGRIVLEEIYRFENTFIRKNGRLLSEEYKEDGIHVTAYVPVELFEELYR